ncbi:hypothetical protein FEK33_03175 [Nocardia asteroides NBRC 15531]|uniref:Uncharacterized protein n=1 Tax=Nocardia asteroides NBRC 15531 TaxID=1110697 RepID=U5EDD0_NOCAS|nr:hypothetical protein [Nocardia asteroides]TLF69321.1 hypothetical protein FEK33_03175 [Nocardia asteroides NBRC 15531]UGT48813.1 hypothetical protein LT345_31010 [Nocardia asteroides]SFL71587.1 hypothetical protein SAMN05444423_101645 [Nocardia asteroides]VEG31428.1 Uncharacterised protein [Nocardia asteroides]GAD85350.1 hypothetical protein NCAST_31_00440 [Nocardia asteroides NBRC 15531]
MLLSSSVWTRVLSGLGACVAAVLVLVYTFVLLFEGMPDEEVSAGRHALAVAKLIVAGAAGLALIVGTASAWRWVILGGCALFFADLALWLVWYSGVFHTPTYEHPEPGPIAQPLLFWLLMLTVWGAFPGLLAILAWRRRPERPHPPTNVAAPSS